MREIIFKAKDLKGNWIKGTGIIKCSSDNSIGIIGENIHEQINPETVCQYIGSLSIDKQKIYESDKLLFSNEEFTVVYFDGKFTLAKDGKPYIYNPKFELCEVTGNIHD